MKATALLKRQHREVEALFGQVKKTTAPAKRRTLLEEIESHLRAHMMIEEGIFYPAVAEGATGKKLRDEDGVLAARPDVEADDADADEDDEDEDEDDEVDVAPSRSSRARPHAR
jgi:iron-sulfur cluster repair protein YtfE (RIC family)